MSRLARNTPVWAFGIFALAACSGGTGIATQSEDASSRAVVTIERTERLTDGEDGEREASAVARFANLPVDSDGGELLVATGIEPEPLLAGECRTERLGQTEAPLEAEPATVELIDAGSVFLNAQGHPVVDLAPLAFPGVNGFGSGVLYATRDLAASPFPPGAAYTLTTTGSASLPLPIQITAQAPESIESVSLNGTPLEDADVLPATGSLDVTWSEGQLGDLVLVRLSQAGTGDAIACAFDDSRGIGSVPARWISVMGLGPQRIDVRRQRTTEVAADGIDLVRVRFDFRLTKPIILSE